MPTSTRNSNHQLLSWYRRPGETFSRLVAMEELDGGLAPLLTDQQYELLALDADGRIEGTWHGRGDGKLFNLN